jgi:hypothetical protein
MAWRMQEPHKEGLANHLDPKSGADGHEAVGEASAGAHAGQPLSSEITLIGVTTPYGEGEGNIKDGVNRESCGDAAESKSLSMRGNSMRENREISKTPSRVTYEGGPEKAICRTSGVNVFEESDNLVVPAKWANKVGQPSTAEAVEGRRSRKGLGLHADQVPGSPFFARSVSRRASHCPELFLRIFLFRHQAQDLRQVHAPRDLTTCQSAAMLWICLRVRATESR